MRKVFVFVAVILISGLAILQIMNYKFKKGVESYFSNLNSDNSSFYITKLDVETSTLPWVFEVRYKAPEVKVDFGRLLNNSFKDDDFIKNLPDANWSENIKFKGDVFVRYNPIGDKFSVEFPSESESSYKIDNYNEKFISSGNGTNIFSMTFNRPVYKRIDLFSPFSSTKLFAENIRSVSLKLSPYVKTVSGAKETYINYDGGSFDLAFFRNKSDVNKNEINLKIDSKDALFASKFSDKIQRLYTIPKFRNISYKLGITPFDPVEYGKMSLAVDIDYRGKLSPLGKDLDFSLNAKKFNYKDDLFYTNSKFTVAVKGELVNLREINLLLDCSMGMTSKGYDAAIRDISNPEKVSLMLRSNSMVSPDLIETKDEASKKKFSELVKLIVDNSAKLVPELHKKGDMKLKLDLQVKDFNPLIMQFGQLKLNDFVLGNKNYHLDITADAVNNISAAGNNVVAKFYNYKRGIGEIFDYAIEAAPVLENVTGKKYFFIFSDESRDAFLSALQKISDSPNSDNDSLSLTLRSVAAPDVSKDPNIMLGTMLLSTARDNFMNELTPYIRTEEQDVGVVQ